MPSSKSKKKAVTSGPRGKRKSPSESGPTARRGRKARPGRLSAHGGALTPELIVHLVAYVAAGNPRKYAAQYVGVGERTLQRWVAEGREQLEGQGTAIAEGREPSPLGLEGHLFRELACAEAEFRSGLVGKVAKAKDWRAWTWLLERMDHREFGRALKVEPVAVDEHGQEQSAADLLIEKILQIKGQADALDSGEEPPDEAVGP